MEIDRTVIDGRLAGARDVTLVMSARSVDMPASVGRRWDLRPLHSQHAVEIGLIYGRCPQQRQRDGNGRLTWIP